MNALTPFPDAVPLAAASLQPDRREDASLPRGAAIAFSGVTKRFGATGVAAEVTALDDVTLDVAPGSITGIIGRSGAGKSTLLRTINGLDRPTAGTVWIDGIDVGARDGAELRALRREIGMIFQHVEVAEAHVTVGYHPSIAPRFSA